MHKLYKSECGKTKLKLYKSECSKTKLTDYHYISDNKQSMILNYVKKSSYSKYKKNSVHKLLFGHVQILET